MKRSSLRTTYDKAFGIGIDPDLHTTPIVLIQGNQILDIEICTVNADYRDRSAGIRMAKLIGYSIEAIIHRNENLLKSGNKCYIGVEGQEVYMKGVARPNDIVNLALVTGACLAYSFPDWPIPFYVESPLPKDWKGQVPKRVSQRKILEEFKIPSTQLQDSCRPSAEYLKQNDFPNVKLPDWKHVVDAMGLALWVAQRRQR